MVLNRLRARYADVQLNAPRILQALETADDLYVDHLTQIRLPAWHHGRVVLAGDAAWCVTPLGGGGASLALTGGYVLAAELSRNSAELPDALQRYDAWMRPLVDEVQRLPPGLIALAYPWSRAGLVAQRLGVRFLTSRPLRPLLARFTQVARTSRELPGITTVAP